LSGPRDPRDPRDFPDEPYDPYGPNEPYDEPWEPFNPWPERDLGGPEAPEEPEQPEHPGQPEEPEQPSEPERPEYEAGERDEAGTDDRVSNEPIPLTAPEPAWNPRQLGERRKPTTAEQAVPWLVGAVLALAGIVIVLLALIFSDANGGFALSTIQPTPLVFPSTSTAPSLSAHVSPSASPSASASPSPAPTKPPTYGALEMLYLTRPTAASASELLRDDFATSTGPVLVEASSNADVTHYAVAPDGTVSVAIVSGKLLGLTKGKPARVLATTAASATFGADATKVFAVRIATGSTNDQATITAITFGSGRGATLSTITYRHPTTPQLTGLAAARFLDDGGPVRIYSTSDGNLLLWVSGAGQWRIDPVSGSTVAATRQPVLWSPDGAHRIVATVSGNVTTLSELGQDSRSLSRTSITGQISHLRWSPHGNRVVFTVGITLAGGGVRQDLYVWDLVNGRAASALTANGASFGGEWLGSAQFWQP
jgi:hypothetical protein